MASLPSTNYNTQSTQLINNSMSGETKVLDDELETQVMDVVDVDIHGETQIVDSDDETQVVDDDDDDVIAGETQAMDGYDLCDNEDTQQLDVSDNEGSEVTQPLDDDTSINVHVEDTGTAPAEKETSRSPRVVEKDDRDTSMVSENVAQSSGSSKRGFASIRTASLRAARLAARRTFLKIDDDQSHCSVSGCLSSELVRCDDNGLIENSKELDAGNGMTKHNGEGLFNGDKCNVAKSLARKLFMEEGATEMESDPDASDRSEGFPEFPSCDNNLAGLSYVDSQEPGDLSQANALEFVDKFLQVNMFESDQGEKCKNAVGDIIIPGSITKGAQSIAQNASRRSTHPKASIYEWDDNLEDDGGGEFFIKKKDVLLGHNSCPRPQNSKHHERRVSLSVGNLRNEKELRVAHDTTMEFLHSDLKSVDGGKKGRVKRRVMEEDGCSVQALEASSSAQSVDMQNVGIDTQMAAEAIEALATGRALRNNDSCVAEQSGQSEDDHIEKEAMEDGNSKRSHQERAWLSKSGVATRSRLSTSGVVTRSRSKKIVKNSGLKSKCRSEPKTLRGSNIGKVDVSLVKPNEKGKRPNTNDFLVVSRGKPSDTDPVSVGDKRKESILEQQLHTNPPRLLKRRSLRGSSSILSTIIQEAVQCVESPNDRSDNCRGIVQCIEAVQETRNREREGVVSEKFNNRKESLDKSTSTDHDKVDESYCKRKDDQHASRHDLERVNKGYKLSAFGGPEITTDFIARRTRSKKSCVQGTVNSGTKKGLLISGLLPSEDGFQSSFKKQDANTPPGKGTLASTTVDVTPENKQKSSQRSDVTPVHSKTSASAVSPVCIGDGYQTPSCKRRVSLTKECISLISSDENRSSSPFKGLRQRRDMNCIRVLFSQHLDDGIIKQQKKILSRLGVSEASTILEATHFVADSFVRTRNMLEAIANGKPVVTHFWLENCGQSNCFIDEKNYILRDAKKEKELSFSMPKSLAHASRYPLLEGKRVLITPNVKPGKEVISSLVKSVRGQAVERLGRYISNNDKLLDDLLVLSCEEDFGVCKPLLEKGISVYSSELLLNGIITQRLEYERYRLFVSHVKKTRSSLLFKKGEEQVLIASRIK